MKLEMRKLTEICPYPNNPRKNDGKGQILAGNIIGAMKGLDKILARQAVFSRGPLRQVVEKL